MISRVGFVGLGNMGAPIAARLTQAGIELVVTDVAADAETRFLADNPVARRGNDEEWQGVDALILVVPTSDVVEQVLLKDDLLGKLSPGTLVIDMSSSEPLRTRALASIVEAHGCTLIDAPVSGGVRGAIAGQLAILVGGASEHRESIDSLMAHVGRTVIHVGSVGSGHAAKALNNMVSAGALSLTVEALRTAEQFGIDPATMNDVLNASSGRTNTSENKVRQFMLSGSFDSGFSQALMTKDVGIAVSLADQLGAPLQVGSTVRDQWAAVSRRVGPSADHTEMYRLIEASE